MKGGIGKIFRNLAASKAHSEFEKVRELRVTVSCVATHQGDVLDGLEGAQGETRAMYDSLHEIG